MKNFIILIFMLCTINAKSEDRIKVAIIDSGIGYSQYNKEYTCKTGHLSFIDDNIYDEIGHGTNIVSIISKSINPKTHCIVSYKVYSNKSEGKVLYATIDSLKHIAKDYSVRVLNISMGGHKHHIEEKNIINRLLLRGVKIAVAAGNNEDNLDFSCNYFPACYSKELKYSNFYIVASELISSNRGSVVTDIFSGNRVGTPVLSGTSQATAQKTAKILKDMVYNNRRLDDKLRQTSSSNRRTGNYR